MKLHSLVSLMLTTLVLSDAGKEDPSKKEELKQLEGVWKVVSIKSEDEGDAPQEMVRHMKVLIEGNKYTTLFGDQIKEETFRLDTTKSPKTIDLTRTPLQGFVEDSKKDNPLQVKRDVLRGIYALEGDRLRICLAEPGTERPTDFPSKPPVGMIVLVLQRDKSVSAAEKIKEIKIMGKINKAGGHAFHGEEPGSDQLYVSLGPKKGDKELERIAPYLKEFNSITGLHLYDSKVTDSGLAHLKGINNIDHINLSKTAITDAGLDHLKGMTKLRLLIVNGTKVTDSGIRELKKTLSTLEVENLTPVQQKANEEINRAGGILFTNAGQTVRVDFRGEAVTDAKLGELKEYLEVWKASLKGLSFPRSRITDKGLEHLKGLTNLKRLKLTGAKVTADGMSGLERALPGLKIDR